MSPDLIQENIINNKLQDGEEILWTGRPNPERFNRISNRFHLGIAFILFSCIFLTLAYSIVSHNKIDFPFQLIPIIFMIIGIAQITPYFIEKINAAKTVYIITNRRILIVVGHADSGVESYYSSSIRELERREYQNGEGDILFGSPDERDDLSPKVLMGYSTTRIIAPQLPTGIYGIRDAKEVENLIARIFFSGELNQATNADSIEFSALPASLSELLNQELQPDEKLLWNGIPERKRFPLITFPFLFMTVWTTFAYFISIFFVIIFITNHDKGFYAAAPMCLLFCFVGTMVMRSFFFEQKDVANSYYAVTSKRIIIATYGKKASSVKSAYRHDIIGTKLKKSRKHLGDVYFGSGLRPSSLFSQKTFVNNGQFFPDLPTALYGVQNAENVENLIVKQFLEAR